MNFSRTPLLLALLTALCPAAQAADTATTPQTTDLAPVQVKASTHNDRHGTAIDAYGNASLHDTPASVTVIGRRQIEDRQIRTLSELAREDASLGDNYAPVGYYQDISIRGYPLDPATGFRFNNLTVTGEQEIALEDKQQVQVLKGLAGLQAGVMEPGGVVNYVSKRPANVRTVTLGTDSHGSRYGALDLGGWLTPDFGLRANLAWEDTHSYVHHADGRRNFYSIAADWHITPKATLELDSDDQASAQRSVSGYQLLGGSVIPPHASTSRMLGFEPWQQPVSVHTSNTSARFNFAFDDDWIVRLAAGHSRSVINDNVAFAYGCFYSPDCASGATPGNFFAPNGDYDVYDYRSPDDTRVSDEARATLQGHFDTGSVSHDISVGTSAFRRTIDRRVEVYDYVGTANIADVDPPYFPPSPNQPGASRRRLTSWQHSVFALDRIHLGDHWQVIAGDRFVRLHERAWDSSGVLERDTVMSKALPQAAVLWQPTAPLTAYLSYSEGLSLGEEAPYWTSNNGDMLAPRLSRQIEAGVKYAMSDAFDLTGAIYHIRQPYQFAQPDNSAAGFTFVQHGEEVHTGLELGAQGRVSDNLHVTASASFIRAEAQNTGTPAYEGHQVANVPHFRAVLHADYRLPFLPKLSLLGGWRYASPNVATPDGRVRVSAYNVFDAGLRYATQWHDHALTWRLSMDNVFNRFYWRDTGSSGGDSYLFPGAQRLARLSLTMAL
ncbi:TonB-dependent siderophore receptor [Rhodanobacter glycinis]|uniref:Iron complex outermembrane recepter protein n=1 Tax=Rhodanobacter glycinis TaxID=582702 RepID=A0A1I3XPR5_9GAMM|nr:TonB-dependent siderophore receptor [Rhodanobacter glycinis]SFK21485.1 iron complex outermembrane recepter protein [Rhodanobacter glycinis]